MHFAYRKKPRIIKYYSNAGFIYRNYIKALSSTLLFHKKEQFVALFSLTILGNCVHASFF
ncbi:hypothetical protein CW304_29140 [Bacillus sp. UFRGS-B20]|nr:hypothetical protein CW304_29140 [Bacillus sp. UFRGS-B20]